MIKLFIKKIFYLIKYLSWIDPKTKIGKGTKIRPFTVIEENVIIGEKCIIGPKAHLRPGTVLGKNVHIGNFVEIKNSIIGQNTKIKHLAYIGDTEIGKNVNIGAGTKIANSDGKKKHKTLIQDNAYIGINVSLVAPVKIGKDAYIAAGSTITEDVPPYALAIGRGRQVNKGQWVKVRNLRRMIRKKLEEKGYYKKGSDN